MRVAEEADHRREEVAVEEARRGLERERLHHRREGEGRQGEAVAGLDQARRERPREGADVVRVAEVRRLDEVAEDAVRDGGGGADGAGDVAALAGDGFLERGGADQLPQKLSATPLRDSRGKRIET